MVKQLQWFGLLFVLSNNSVVNGDLFVPKHRMKTSTTSNFIPADRKQFYCDKEFIPSKPGGFTSSAGKQACCILDNTGILALFVNSFTYCYKEVEIGKMVHSYDVLKVVTWCFFVAH
jgi:hypothetical protein